MEPVERETIISWNDADPVVTVFTCHRRIMAKMEKLGVKAKDKSVLDGRLHHCEYEVPKDTITVSINAKKRGTATQIENLKKARVLSPIGKKKVPKNDFVTQDQ